MPIDRWSRVTTAFAAGSLLLTAIPAQAGVILSSSILPYIGPGNQRAQLRFESSVEVYSEKIPSDRRVSQAIEGQIHLLSGPLQWGSSPAISPSRTHSVSHVQIAAVPGKPGHYTVSYRYEGLAVVPHSAETSVKMAVALHPDAVYKASTQGLKPGQLNPCTDDHYQSAGDFWYFWSPLRTGCKLKEGVDYALIDAQILPLPNTRSSLPEYSRMVSPQRVIPISLFFGLDESFGDANAYRSEDQGATPYLDTVNGLEKLGFTRLTKAPGTNKLGSLSETFEKDVSTGGHADRIRVNLFLGNTRYYSTHARPFHEALKTALENHPLVIYSGHSGMGRNLSLPQIAQASGVNITLKPDLYQVLFFDSCSSYEYYNEAYFRAKATAADPAGSRNLDIITNGLESAFGDGARRILAILSAVDDWAVKGKASTYSEILSRFPGEDSLPGVLGDEDNPIAAESEPAPSPTPSPTPTETSTPEIPDELPQQS